MSGGSTLVSLVDSLQDEDGALVFPDGTLLRQDLREASARLARAMQRCGLRHGDRIGLWLPNVTSWLIAAFACWRLGAVVFPLNPRLQAKELGELLARSGCRAIVVLSAGANSSSGRILQDLVEERRLPSLVIVFDQGEDPAVPAHVTLDASNLASENPAPFSNARPEDGCIVFATSGTTRAPKLVLHTHERVERQLACIATNFGLSSDAARVVLALPLSGAFGLTIALLAIWAKRPLYIQDRFVPDETARLINEQTVTHALGTDDMLDKLLDAAPGTPAFPSLRFYGYARYNPALTGLPERAQQRGVRLRGMFGMSELLAFFAGQPEDVPFERRTLAGGVPLCPEARARIRLLDTGEEAPPGVEGEIEVLSPNTFVEYLGDPAATGEAFTPDGWFKTGDLGYATEDGGFVYLSRIKDVMRIGGYLVNPIEIEDVVAQMDGVAACQVVAVPFERSTRPVACVLLKPGAALDEGDAIAFCRSSMAVYKTPVRILVMESFPTTDGPNGSKVQKAILRDQVLHLLNDSSGSGATPGRANSAG